MRRQRSAGCDREYALLAMEWKLSSKPVPHGEVLLLEYLTSDRLVRAVAESRVLRLGGYPLAVFVDRLYQESELSLPHTLRVSFVARKSVELLQDVHHEFLIHRQSGWYSEVE